MAENKQFLVSVLLPLKLSKPYTYSVPSPLNSEIKVGVRVLVPFGNNKFYAGIVTSLDVEFEEGVYLKSIQEVLDEKPIVGEIQIDFWRWIATYYMSEMGLVMDSALPSYYKLSSEKYYSLNNDIEIDKDELSRDEEELIEEFKLLGEVPFKKLREEWFPEKGKSAFYHLLDLGIIRPIEVIKEKYQVKYATTVTLTNEYKENEARKTLLEKLQKKSPKQYTTLLAYYALSPKGLPVWKSELMERSSVSQSALKALEEKGVFKIGKEAKHRFELSDKKATHKIKLSSAQSAVFNTIKDIHKSGKPCLLRGVTGSGKTEIYIKLIEEALEKGQTTLLILPEIALTQQMVTRMSQHFGQNFIIYHSQINQHQKYELWNQVQGRDIKFILGTRSSIFLPFPSLDLVIIDEEHDYSLKQQDRAPQYHARDASIYLSQYYGSRVLLGSATPSLESYHNAEKGKYGYVELLERYGDATLPIIKLVDMKHPEVKETKMGDYSELLIEEIKKRIQRDEQVILFQNRRGYSPYIQCMSCGDIQMCDNCDVKLTYHSYKNTMMCHYCNQTYPFHTTCPACKSNELKTRGLGTQKIEEEISMYIPDAKIARLDTDVIKSSLKLEQILTDFQQKKYQILVGTQMVSKGLDFESLTLLGVISADVLFAFIDYRTDEKAFQTLYQASGRVGRREKQGEVIIQTYMPQHAVLKYVMDNDWEGFAKNELVTRQEFIYPPFCKLIRITIRHSKVDLVSLYATKLTKEIAKRVKCIILGPTEPNISKIRNKYIRIITIKIPLSNDIASDKQKIKQTIDEEMIKLPNKNFILDIEVDA